MLKDVKLKISKRELTKLTVDKIFDLHSANVWNSAVIECKKVLDKKIEKQIEHTYFSSDIFDNLME